MQFLPLRKLISLALAATAVGAGVVSCATDEKNSPVIAATAGFTATLDSIYLPGGDIVTAHNIAPTTVPDGFPTLKSPSPLLDAAFASAMAQYDTLFTSPATHMRPADNFELWQSLSLLNPQRCMNILAAQVSDATVAAHSPLSAEYGLWTVAAREAALASGSREWLARADSIARNAYIYNERVLMSATSRLLQGHTYFSTPIPNALPRWMSVTDRFECMTALGNASAVGAANAIADNARSLGLSDSTAWSKKAAALAAAVNTNLWQPHLRRYAQYLYIGVFPIPSPIADNAAQALAILFSVPTPEMSRAVLESTPALLYGMPLYYPTLAGTPPVKPFGFMPEIQALWALASSRYPGTASVSVPVGVLLAQSSLSGARPAAARMLALTVLRVLAGIQLGENAMTFRPVVPKVFKDGFTVSGLRYRNVVIDLTVSGYGSRIARFAVDGTETDRYSLPATLSGNHTVEITLANNSLPLPGSDTAPQTWAPPVPEIDWRNKYTGYITDPTPSVSYIEYINGAIHTTLDSAEVTVTARNAYSRVCVVPVSRQRAEGFSAKPHSVYPAAFARNLQAEDFATPATPLVRDRRLTKRFVESSPDKNSTVTFTCAASSSRLFALSLCYSNGAGDPDSANACALRRVTVNGAEAGTLVMPAAGSGWWLATSMSNTLAVHLRQGENIITVEYSPLLYIPGSQARTVLYDYLRITRLK